MKKERPFDARAYALRKSAAELESGDFVVVERDPELLNATGRSRGWATQTLRLGFGATLSCIHGSIWRILRNGTVIIDHIAADCACFDDEDGGEDEEDYPIYERDPAADYDMKPPAAYKPGMYYSGRKVLKKECSPKKDGCVYEVRMVRFWKGQKPTKVGVCIRFCKKHTKERRLWGRY